MTEGEPHKQLVALTKKMMAADGWQPLENDWTRGWGGWQFPKMITDKGPKQWTIDAYFAKKGMRVACEVDRYVGRYSHGSKHAQIDDAYRDTFLEMHFGIITVRLNLKHFTGKERLNGMYILAEVYRALSKRHIVTEAKYKHYLARAEYMQIDPIYRENGQEITAEYLCKFDPGMGEKDNPKLRRASQN